MTTSIGVMTQLSLLITLTHGYSTGVPPGHCWDLEPRHGYDMVYQKEEIAPYHIIVTDAQAPGEKVRVKNGEEVNLKLYTRDPDSRGFKGFILVAEVGENEDRRRVGNFQSDTNLTQPGCRDMSGLTHSTADEKMELNVTWTAPPYPFKGEVQLWGTFVQTWRKYWVEMEGSSLIEVTNSDDDMMIDESEGGESLSEALSQTNNAISRMENRTGGIYLAGAVILLLTVNKIFSDGVLYWLA